LQESVDRKDHLF